MNQKNIDHNDSYHSISKKVFIYVIAILLIISVAIVCMFHDLFFVSGYSGDSIDGSTAVLNYKIYDNLVGDAEKSFFANQDALDRLKSFYTALSESKDFVYLEMYSQPISIDNYKEPSWYTGLEPIHLELENGYVGEFSDVEALWLGDTAISALDLSVDEGRAFSSDDFQYDADDDIPIILGHGYKSVYEIGDVVYCDMIVVRGTAKVIGFLQENSSILFCGNESCLDNYVIVPMINSTMETAGEDQFFEKILYLMKINGAIVADDKTANDLQILLTQICNEYNIYPGSYVDGATNYSY